MYETVEFESGTIVIKYDCDIGGSGEECVSFSNRSEGNDILNSRLVWYKTMHTIDRTLHADFTIKDDGDNVIYTDRIV